MADLSRILFIGVDAGDKDLILRWAAAGVLPTFRALLERGTWGLTVNPIGLYVGAIWPSFWTGLSPARHGRYCYSQINTGTYEHYTVTPKDTSGVAFWDTLSQAGRKVAILDVPKALPSTHVRGIHVVDWGTHDPELGFCTSPTSLAGEIESRFGRHPVRQCDAHMKRGPSHVSSLRDGLVRGVEQKTELATHFLEHGGWDLFLTVFAESHCVGHQCWHIHDSTHPRHDAALARAVGDPIRDVYVAIDGAIGRLLARVGDDTTVFVLASHGMGPHYDGTFLLDEILRRLFSKPDVPKTTRAITRAAESCWRRVPPAVRARLRPLRNRVKRALSDAVTSPELASTACFQTPNNDVYGGIRVNLEGREPEGKIRPGAEYDDFCEGLTRDLLNFVDVETGRPIVRRVLRTADLYRGERLQDLPDLMVEWDRESPISAIHSPKTGTIRGVFRGIRTGDHKPEGLFVAVGPGVLRGRLSTSVSITQFAPTIASMLGVRLPDVDDTVIELTRTDRSPVTGARPA